MLWTIRKFLHTVGDPYFYCEFFSCRHYKSLPRIEPTLIRKDVTPEAIERFYERDWLERADGEVSEKLEAVTRYAISYKEAFHQLEKYAMKTHMEAVAMREAIFEVKEMVDKLDHDCGVSLRIMGGVCQQIKV